MTNWCIYLSLQKNMKRPVFIISFFLLFPVWMFSQGCINFNYDLSGNRISRSCQSFSKRTKISRNSRATMYVEFVGNNDSMNISYNRNTDKIILKNSQNKKVAFYMYNNSGIRLCSRHVTNSIEIIPMDCYPTGIYIIELEIDNKIHSSKITKK